MTKQFIYRIKKHITYNSCDPVKEIKGKEESFFLSLQEAIKCQEKILSRYKESKEKGKMINIFGIGTDYTIEFGRTFNFKIINISIDKIQLSTFTSL